MSPDPQADGLTAREFSRLTAEINSTVRKYSDNLQPQERALLESLEQLFVGCAPVRMVSLYHGDHLQTNFQGMPDVRQNPSA